MIWHKWNKIFHYLWYTNKSRIQYLQYVYCVFIFISTLSKYTNSHAYCILYNDSVYVNNLHAIFKEQLNTVCVNFSFHIKKKQQKNHNYLDTFNFHTSKGHHCKMHQCKYFHLPLETWSYIYLKIETDNIALRFFAKLRYKKETKMFDNNSALKLSQFYIMYNFQHSLRFYILTTNRWITKKHPSLSYLFFKLFCSFSILFYFQM